MSDPAVKMEHAAANAKFRQIEVKKRGLMVAEQILAAVRDGTILAGQRLPPERELAVQMGVSRPSVREALSALQLTGAVETRHGNGTFVTESARDLAVLSQSITDIRRSAEYVQALEARRVIEKGMARLIVVRRTPAALDAIKEALEAMRSGAQLQHFAQYSEANTAFHSALAHAAGNPVLEWTILPMCNIALNQIAQELRRLRYDKNSRLYEVDLASHQRIYSAIVDGDLNGLIEAIDMHYDVVEQSL